MKSRTRLQLHFQLVIPVILAFLMFGIVVHLVWGPGLLDSARDRIIDRETDIARNILPTISRDMIASDFGSLYETFRDLEATNSDEKMSVELFDITSNRLYPLSNPEDYTTTYTSPITITIPVISSGEILGKLKLTIDANSELSEIHDQIFSLEIFITVIAASALILLLLLQYLLIGRPILALTKATQQIAGGDLSSPIPNHLASNIGGLGAAFSNMQYQLKSSKEKLEDALHKTHDESTRFSTVLKSIPGALLVLDEDGQIEDQNQAAEEIFGYSRSALIGSSYLKLFPDQQSKAEIADCLKTTSDQTTEVEIKGLSQDGHQIPLRLYLRNMHIAGSTKLLVIAMDITQIVKIHEELFDALTKAKKANNAKSAFLSRMSHELRTPLNAIIGFSQLLASDEKLTHPVQKENVDEILHAGEQLLQMVNEVLDLNNLEAGKLKMDKAPNSLEDSINHVIQQLLSEARKREISIHTEGLHNLPTLYVDKDRLAQLLFNLISNAIKYNHIKGDIQIKARQNKNSDSLHISITDTGPGITPENITRLFRPFKRLKSPYEGIEGTGIGLVICKRLVEAMEGTIGVESELGRGSNFWFELPLNSPQKKTPAASSLMRILYVEDNPANARLLGKLASLRGGIEMLYSKNAEQGLIIAKQDKPALIFMDINLPGINGFEALKQLRINPLTKPIPVVAITANAMQEDIQRIESSNFNDYLIKPLDINRFNELMDKYTARAAH